MTLQDHDTIESDYTETRQHTPAAARAKQVRSRAVFNVAEGTVTVQNSDGIPISSYKLDDLPDTVMPYLTLIGLHRVIAIAKDPTATYANLRAGELPGRVGRPAKAPKDKALSPWLEAYAHAKMEQIGSALTIEHARGLAKGLDKKARGLIKINPLVVKHYVRLTNAPADLV